MIVPTGVLHLMLKLLFLDPSFSQSPAVAQLSFSKILFSLNVQRAP
jgi:hypothetical protein